LFCRTAEAEEKQVEASRLAANDPFSGSLASAPLSVGFSVGFVFKGAVGGNDAV
jgi:hypothetical protein